MVFLINWNIASLNLDNSFESKKLWWMLFTICPGISSTILWTLLTLSNCRRQDFRDTEVFSDTFKLVKYFSGMEDNTAVNTTTYLIKVFSVPWGKFFTKNFSNNFIIHVIVPWQKMRESYQGNNFKARLWQVLFNKHSLSISFHLEGPLCCKLQWVMK